MSNSDDVGGGKPRAPHPNQTCLRCGGIASAVAMLASRQGKTFRMFRCNACEQISCLEDR